MLFHLGDIYFWVLFTASILSALVVFASGRMPKQMKAPILVALLFLYAVLAIGLIPVTLKWTGGDRANYAVKFLSFVHNAPFEAWGGKDIGFSLWMLFLTPLRGPLYFFLVTAFAYVGMYLLAARRISKQYMFLMFLMILSTFQFYNYGTNTLRAGLAVACLMWAFTYYQEPKKMYVLMAVSLSIHFSMIIPIAAAIVSKYYNKPRFFFYFWCFCVLLSAVSGTFFQNLFLNLGIIEETRTSYFNVTEKVVYKTGFRVDFIIYSCVPIVLGALYRIKKGFRDKFYEFIYGTYIIANAFWLLVIRMNFTDRVAYLSWFLYPILLLYPIFKKPDMFKNSGMTYSVTVILYELFMLVMVLR